MTMDPWKLALIYALPGLVFDTLGFMEWRRGSWPASKLKLAMWLSIVLLMGPFFLVGLLWLRSRGRY